MAKSTTLAIMSVANDEFNKGNRGLAIDVARAVTEGRVCWRVESNLRALTEADAQKRFDDLVTEVGEGASARKVYDYLDARFPQTFVVGETR